MFMINKLRSDRVVDFAAADSIGDAHSLTDLKCLPEIEADGSGNFYEKNSQAHKTVI